jgi:hypothetical protein
MRFSGEPRMSRHRSAVNLPKTHLPVARGLTILRV